MSSKTELKDIVGNIEKKYGSGSLILMGESKISKNVEFLSTGCLSLDLALGGGFAKGRIVECYGGESSTKTTTCLHALAECQKNKGVGVLIDAEHAFDPIYAANLGVDVDSLLLSQPDNAEQGLDIVDMLLKDGRVDIIIIDSVAALTPKAEIDGEIGDSKMGLQARLMSQTLRKITASASKSNCCVVFINQLREKIGVMFGNPEVTTGGNALKFYSSQRIDFRRSTQDKDGDEVTGNKIIAKVIKNKVAPPFRKAEYHVVYGEGIDILKDLISVAVDLDIIHKAGSWFSYDETKLGQGIDKVKELLSDNPELVEEIKTKIYTELAK